MVLFTSGWTVPLAFSSVGRSRLSTLTLWNSSGWSTVKRLGSTVISCFVGAALGSLEQATERANGGRHSRMPASRRTPAAESFGADPGGGRAAAALQEPADCPTLAALEPKRCFACDVMD